MSPKDLFPLTQKELSVLNDHLHVESLMAQKCRFYAEMAEDHQIKTLFAKLAESHQSHYDRIYSYLRDNMELQ